ncbi:MAG: leucine-rich repeat domain-containing protein [Bacilli bacterium]
MKKLRATLFYLLGFSALLLHACGRPSSDQSSLESEDPDTSIISEDPGTSTVSEDPGTSTVSEEPDSSSGGGSSESSSEIPDEPFDLNDLIFAEVDDGYTVCRYVGNASQIVVPETHQGKPVVSLEKWAFFNRQNLVSITLPDSLIDIGEDAFANCVNLKTVNLGSGVENIRVMAFDSCTSLESITLPESLTHLGTGAFGNCPRLSSINLPNNIQSVAAMVFTNSKLIPYTIYEHGLYLGNSTNRHLVLIDVQDSVGATLKIHEETRLIAAYACESSYKRPRGITSIEFGSKLHTIGSGAFCDCEQLKNFTFPSSLRAIKTMAFSGCLALENLTLNAGLTEIGSYAFEKCVGLDEVVLPESLTTLGMSAFYQCDLHYNVYENGDYLGTATNDYYALIAMGSTAAIHPETRMLGNASIAFNNSLTSVTIPQYVRYILPNLFYGCHNLTEIKVAEANPYFSSPLNATIVEKASKKLLYGLNDGLIPDGVEIIGASAFYNRSLNEGVTIPSSVKTIEDSAFSNTNLPAITIPDNVTRLGANVFSDCQSLTSVTLSQNIKVIGEWTFSRCRELPSIDLPDGVTLIKERAFNSCDFLASVNFGNQLTQIADIGFQICPMLTNLVFPESLRLIGSSAFSGCINLGALHIGKNIAYIGSYAFGNPGISAITVDQENKYYDARENCQAIIETKTDTLILGCDQTLLPSTVTRIGPGAFMGCGFTTFTIPETIIQIGNNAFEQCENLTQVTFSGDLITEISAYCFAFCSLLNEINLPANVTKLGGGAFMGTALTTFTIPEMVTEIGNSLFSNCFQLTKVTFAGNLITAIPRYCFGGCRALTEINIPSTVTAIGYSAFSYCAFTSFTLEENVTTIEGSVFFYCDKLTEVTITSEEITAIPSDFFNGCSALTTVNLPNSITALGDWAFRECGLTSFTIPEQVVSLGQYLFYGCNKLTAVTFAGNLLAEISQYCFFNCTTLNDITLPSSITKIKMGAFYKCEALTSMNLPSGLTTIEARAFSTCKNITEIIIPLSVTTIGENAFVSCNSLTIYAEAPSKPDGWAANWNSSYRPVYWYSETENLDGQHWHYVHGVPTVWA